MLRYRLRSLAAGIARAAIIVNEVAYDDAGTDNREYVELYNSGAAPVDISGWMVTGRDPTSINLSAAIPAATTLAPGAFYVVGNSAVANVNLVVASDFLENDIESVELRDSGGAACRCFDLRSE
ncbi:MAG: lamin tail domain-containing protein [Pirellulales bacterium]